MSDLDELRQLAIEADAPQFEGIGDVIAEEEDDKIFGLNAIERMFISVGLFLVIAVVSFLILMLTDSIAVP